MVAIGAHKVEQADAGHYVAYVKKNVWMILDLWLDSNKDQIWEREEKGGIHEIILHIMLKKKNEDTEKEDNIEIMMYCKSKESKCEVLQ